MYSRHGVTATTDMAVLPRVLNCRPCDVPFRYASEPIPRCRGTVARLHAHPRGLATAIHEISGLGFFAFHAVAKFIDTVTAVKSMANLALGHNRAGIAFVVLITCRTDKLRICHFKTPVFTLMLHASTGKNRCARSIVPPMAGRLRSPRTALDVQ